MRSFIIGTRLCPPARILASSPCSTSSATASSTVAGAKYSNAAGYTCCSIVRLKPDTPYIDRHMKIDVFNHIVTPRYRARRLEIAPARMRLQDQERVMPTLFDLDARFRVMDGAGDGYVQI